MFALENSKREDRLFRNPRPTASPLTFHRWDRVADRSWKQLDNDKMIDAVVLLNISNHSFNLVIIKQKSNSRHGIGLAGTFTLDLITGTTLILKSSAGYEKRLPGMGLSAIRCGGTSLSRLNFRGSARF